MRDDWGLAPLISVQVSPWEYLQGLSAKDIPCNEGTLHAPHLHYVTTRYGLEVFQCLGQGQVEVTE